MPSRSVRRCFSRLFDAVGDVNKSVATDVLSSPARVIGWIDEVLDTLEIEHCAFVGGVDRHLDGDALRNGTARARQTAGNAEPRRHRESTAHWADLGPLPLPVGLWGPRLIVETSEPRRARRLARRKKRGATRCQRQCGPRIPVVRTGVANYFADHGDAAEGLP